MKKSTYNLSLFLLFFLLFYTSIFASINEKTLINHSHSVGAYLEKEDKSELPPPNCPEFITTGIQNGDSNVASNEQVRWWGGLTASVNRIVVSEDSVTVFDSASFTDPFTYNWLPNKTYNVRLYNDSLGSNICPNIFLTFTTVVTLTVPNCPLVVTPNALTDMQTNTAIQWNAVSGATGYTITVGTTSGGTDIANNVNLNTSTSYLPVGGWLDHTVYYFTIRPYNNQGSADCVEIIFITTAHFITTWRVEPGDLTVTIPTTGGGYGYYVADWGDGTSGNVGYIGNSSHTYASAGDYTIKIIGNFPRIYFNNEGDSNKIISIDQWGNQQWTSMANAFYGCSNLAGQATDEPDLSVVTDMSKMFRAATLFNQNISSWNTIDVANMEGMLRSAESFDQDISSWNTTNVTNMKYMLYKATAFDQNIGSWDVTSLLEAENMFGEVTLSTENYDALLIGWNSQNLQAGVVFSGGKSKYCSNAAHQARLNMQNTTTGDSWTITDLGRDPDCMIPSCTLVTSPSDTATGVALASELTWTATANTTGYRITIGTTSGGTEIENALDVGTSTTYIPTSDWEAATTYYVTVIAYNAQGDSTGCAETSFSTTNIIPNCTLVTSPSDTATGVALASELTWTATANTTGYRITIGTTSGGTEIENALDVGTSTTYIPTSDWEAATTYYVTVIAYNTQGNAIRCTETSFSTVGLPACAMITSPVNNEIEVLLNAGIIWNSVSDATGYRMTIGTTSGGNDVVDNQILPEATTSYIYTSGWLENTMYYVILIAFNAQGDAIDCMEINFTTTAIPNCPPIITPLDDVTEVLLDAVITWTTVDHAIGYRITIGTTSEGNDIEDITNVVGNTYIPSTDWLMNTTYYVTIIAYNMEGEATGCTETSFTTVGMPNCVEIIEPSNGAINVLLTSEIIWTEIENAIGYRITIGTNSGDTDIEDNLDLGDVTNYIPSDLWILGTTYYINIIAYNAQGESENCKETSFTAKNEIFIPDGFTPNGDGINDTFNIVNVELVYKDYKIIIYDRWGSVVYKGKNGWTGESNNMRSLGGGKIVQGTYYLLLQLDDLEIIKKSIIIEY